MINYKAKLTAIFLFAAFLLSCGGKKEEIPSIAFSLERDAIQVKGVDILVLEKLSQLSDSAWVDVVAVHDVGTVGDTLVDPGGPLLGHYTVKAKVIEFRPEQPFVKGHSYQVDAYINADFITYEKALKGRIPTKYRPLSVVMTK